jgi:phage shock protein PspC (stress-responsive transcriptional regulator)
MLAGVSGGLARYFDIHPAFYRVGFVVLTLLGGAGLVIYAAAWLVMPDENKEDSIVTAALRNRRDRPWPLIGLGLLAVAFISILSHATLWPQGDAWFLLLVAGGAILWITRRGRKAEQITDAKALAAEDSRRIRRVLRRLVIAAASIVALILIAGAVFATAFHVHLGRGVGDRTYVASGVQDIHRNYNLGIGHLVVDLSKAQLPAGETRVAARVDVGRLDVIVPNGVAVQVNGKAQVGTLDFFGNAKEGRNINATLNQAGNRLLVLNVHVGAGAVRVTRAVR